MRLFLSTLVLICLACGVSVFLKGNLSGVAALIESGTRSVFAECISNWSDAPLNSFKITRVELNGDDRKDAFVQATEKEACGNAGCVHELCLSDSGGSYIHIPFGYAAHSIAASETKTNGISDLILNNDRSLKMTWDGIHYVLAD